MKSLAVRARGDEMGIKIEFKHQPGKQQSVSQPEARFLRRNEFHNELEARLQDLSERLPNLNADVELNPLKGELALDLRAKVDAVRWMLRIAKHVQDPARERILLTVNSSLDQLERAVNHRSHAA
jgi:hypothetical protein